MSKKKKVVYWIPTVYQRLPADYVDDDPKHPTLGLCDTEDGIININPKQCESELLDTVIHETLHFLFPDHNEKTVDKNAYIIGRVLWKFGYRRKK